MKNIINVVVLGVGHSGTTVLMRMLGACGWNIADKDPWREDPGIRDLNRQIIKSCRAVFGECSNANEYYTSLPSQRDYRAELVKLKQPWAIKDPRMVLTFDFWRRSLDEFSPCVILLTRDATDVDMSYMSRGEFVRGEPGAHGRTTDELRYYANRSYESWNGVKLRVEYEKLAHFEHFNSVVASLADESSLNRELIRKAWELYSIGERGKLTT